MEMTKEPIALFHKLPWGDNFPGVNSCMKSDQKRFKIREYYMKLLKRSMETTVFSVVLLRSLLQEYD